MRRLLSLVLFATLAGCEDPPATTAVVPAVPHVPVTVAASARPASVDTTAPRPTPAPAANATPTAAVAAPQARATQDRADDATGLQLHVLYVLSADAEDKQLDTNGAIARSVAAANDWLARQTGGSRLRLDTAGGQLDVTFFRSTKTHAQLGATPDDWHAALSDELAAAGFEAPNKCYAYYYGGGEQGHGAGAHVVGVGGSGYASVLMSQCVDCELGTTEAGPEEFTLLHETIHALGFVPKCAPHATDTDHTNDDPADLMYAESSADGAPPHLDARHDDYFRNDAQACLDLARSPFMDPLPARAQLPIGRPLAQDPGANPRPFQPTLADPAGSPALEAQMLAALNDARQARGLAPFRPDAGLARLARQGDQLLAGGDLATIARQAGFAGACGMAGFTTEAADDTLLAGFKTSEAFTKLAADASTNALGIGVTHGPAGAQVVLAFANQHLLVDPGPTLGEGPANSYTLALPLQPLVGGRVRAVLDGEEAGAYRLETGKPRTIYVSVPRQGKHEIKLAQETQGGRYLVELTYHVDGDAPLAKAFTP
jgi:hypothetical protein